MINSQAGDLLDIGKSLGKGQTDQQGADQTGPLGYGYAIDLVNGDACLVQRFTDHRIDGFNVPAGGKFRHHAAVFGMHLYLCINDAGEQLCAVLENSGSGFITGTLYAE